MTREEFMDLVYDELYSDGDNNRANRIIDAADSYAEECEPHWISVDELLPEIGEYVLCMIRQQYRGRFHVCHYVDKDKYINHPYFDWRHNGFPDVVAWMPLPKTTKDIER